MKKVTMGIKLICVLLAASLSLCACAAVAPVVSPVATDIVQKDTSPYEGGSPWIASLIPGNANAHPDVELKDDYYLATNRQWMSDNSIKPGYQRELYLNSFSDELNDRIKKLIADSADSNSDEAELVRTYYSTFLDWEARDAVGCEPLVNYLEEIDKITSIDELMDYFCGNNFFLADLFPWICAASYEDASRCDIYIYSPEIILNDPADYLTIDDMDEYTGNTYKAVEELVETVLTKCGYNLEEADAVFEESIEFERMFTRYCYTLDEQVLVETQNTLSKQTYSGEELDKFGRFSEINRIITSHGYPETARLVLADKLDYFNNFDSIVNDDNLALIKSYLIVHSAMNSAEMLDKECFYAAVDLANKLQGAEGYKDEQEYAISVVSNVLGWPLSKMYCDKYVTREDKENLYKVINDTINEYKVMLREEDFLSEETKQEAIKKLDNLVIHCLYPDEWEDYSELELSGNYFDMVEQINSFEDKKSVKDFVKPIDREKFDATPITMNAFYSPSTNSVSILPGLIGDVLYRSDMSVEEVYASVGVIIGHEISHAFDPTGANYDEIGNRKNWWTDADAQSFEERTQKMVDYYDSIAIWDGLFCKGELEKGEACADMAGVKVMLKLAEKQENFDYDLFFRNYSKVWAALGTPDYVQYAALYDSHPLPNLRVNVTLAQFDEFYEIYGIKEGDGMYIPPEDRVKIW